MRVEGPTFPPLLTGHCLKGDGDPFSWAIDKVEKSELSAGDLVWAEKKNKLQFALVLEPEVRRERCHEILYVAMVALGDAIGALVPPEVSVKYQWPNNVLMNDGKIGSVDLFVSDDDEKEVPNWMVLSVDLQILPDFIDDNPGENIDVTTMWDEGCGETTRDELLESVSRHTVAMIHTWSEDGFGPIHKLWVGRLSEKMNASPKLELDEIKGLDEFGNALIAGDGTTGSMQTAEALRILRENHKVA